jgi:hypothetical protein
LNVTDLALALGVNRSNLSGHLARADAPKRDKSGCYALTDVRRYLADRRRLNNDAGGGVPTEALYRLRCQKLMLEVEALRRDLAVASHRYDLAQLAGWVGDLLEAVKHAMPHEWRPELVLLLQKVEGVNAKPVDLLRCCKGWASGVVSTLIHWVQAHGLTVKAPGTDPVPLDLTAILQSAFSERRIPAGAIPATIPRHEVVTMFSEFVASLRSVGVEEAKIREAGNAVTITDARARR